VSERVTVMLLSPFIFTFTLLALTIVAGKQSD
jgi:hypothetical protein